MPNASQTTADLKGDLLSVKMFGAIGDAATDDSSAFQAGIDFLYSNGGGVLRVPKTDGAFYKLDNPVTIKDKVLLVGEGDGSVLFRGADMPAGDGLLIIDGIDAGVQDLKIDGDVTTITNLLYGAGTSSVLFNNDPLDSKLTLNTSIWIRPGAHNFWISGVTITHTGGYAVLVDVIDGDTRNGAILDCFFENNRPHLFGVDTVTPSNNVYGAWTGGVFVKGDCTAAAAKLFAMRGLTVRGCKFHRMNGNCVWSHSNGFDTHHENFVLDQNVFRYIARDGYMIGNVEGGHAHGSMSYVGFTHTTDVDAPAGAYLTNNYAVGFDAAGYVSNFEFSGDVTEVYGGGFDLDGVRDSTVLSPRVFSSQPITKGVQTGDTNGNGGGHNVRIIGGHLSGCNVGAVVLNQADGCLLTGMTIDHPIGASGVPILLYSLDLGTKDSVVTKNVIRYPDAAFCVAESDAGAGTGFDSTTKNFVFDNVCIGSNKGEFYKDPNSASETGYIFSTNVSTPSNRSEFYLQREGQGVTAALKGYTTNTATRKQRFQFQDYRDGSTEDSLLNVSLNGAADTGAVALGDRTSFGFGDVFAGGHLLGYGFIALLGKTATGNVFSDVRADSLTDDWALLRFDETTNSIQQSVSTSGGNRVWSALGGGSGSPGGSDTHVQFNDGGAFGGEAALVWDKTANALTVTGATGTAGIVAATCYIQSEEGFYSPGTSADTVNIPSGGVTALSLIAVRNDASDAWTIVRTSATARQYGFGINSSGELILNDATAALERMKVTTGGVFQWGGTNAQIDQNGNISITAVLASTGASGGVNVPTATASNAIQAPSGGVTAKYLVTTESIFGSAVAAPSVSGVSQGKLHFNSTANKWQYSEDGSSWANCFGTGTVAGANTEIQFNNSGAFGASSNFTWTNASKLLTVTGNTGTAGIATVTCYIQSAEGFLTNDSSSDAVNVPNGGVTALSLISARNDGASGVYISRSSAVARSYGFGVNSSGSLVLRDETGSADRLTMDTAGLITIGSTVAINQSGAVTISGVFTSNGASGGVNVSGSSAYNCIQASNNGGMAARSFTATVYTQMGQNSGTPTVTTSDSLNNGCLYYDTSTNKARVRVSGSFVDIATGSATVAGSDTQIQYNDGGSFGAESAFTWNKTTNVLTVTGSTGTAGIVAATCYIQSAEGFYTTSSSYQGIQAPSGGVYGSSIQAINYTQPGRRSSDPTATSGDTIADGCLYYNTSTAKLKVRISSTFVDVLTGSAGVTSLNSLTGALSIGAGTAINVSPSGSTVTITNTGVTFLSSGTGISVSANTGSVTVTNTGVTSLTAGTGVSVSASTGSVTVSIGQAVSTSSNVTFASVTTGSGGVVQSSATGTSISFQNTNFNFQVNGNGVVSCTTLNVSGSTVINSSRQFVGAGVDVGANGISCGNYNLNGGFIGRTVTTTDGGGNTLIFRGGILTTS